MNPRTLLLFIAMATTQAIAQTADPLEADKNALRALRARYEEAISSGQLAPLADTLTPTASAVFLTGDEVKGLDAMQKFFDGIRQQLGSGSRYTVKVNPDDTQFFGDFALAHGAAEETATLGTGTALTYTTRWTAILRRMDGTWKTERLHVTLNPFDNPVITAQTRIKLIIWVSAAIVAGFLAGWLMARRKSRE